MTKGKTIFFIIFVNTIAFFLILILGEFAARWHNEGSIKAALFSFVNKKTPLESFGTNHWLVYDEDLGYKLNPRSKGVNSLGLRHSEIITEKSKRLFRIIVLGDPLAWVWEGWSV